MNIGQVMRGLMGDIQPGEGKALELKAGQVVRGVVLQVMDDHEALIQINGSQVRAKLETNLAPGQSAMLQVQPPTESGQMVMKTVDAQAAAPSDETVKEWVKSLGLPETKWAGELVRDLRRSGITLNKQVIGQFQQAADMKPARADMQSWMQTAAVAVKRGLPLTEATMKSLHQALSGPPVHELLQKLESSLTQFLGSAQAADGKDAGTAQSAAARVVQLLAEGAELMQLPDESESAASGKTGNAAQSGEAANAVTTETEPTADRTTGRSPGALTAAHDAQPPKTQETANAPTRNQLGGALGQLMKWFGVDHEQLLAQAARDQQTPTETGADASLPNKETAPGTKSSDPSQAPQQGTRAAQAPLTTVVGQQGAAAVAQHQQTASPQSLPASQDARMQQAGQSPPAPLPQTHHGAQASQGTLPQQGTPAPQAADTQPSAQQTQGQGAAKPADPAAEQAVKVPGGGMPERGVGSGLPERTALSQGQLLQVADSINAGARTDAPAPAESLKHALMSLAGSDDVPPSLKETAQQLIQQITGQQLLLSPERNGSPFTHVTMFIPLKTANGDQTASIHIQTRRGRKGELDADNCRLMFDLRMKSLGDTIVDVQVVDKIVSLRLWNDHPAIDSLLDGSRAEITEALKQAGYQLSSLRSTPLPDRLAFASDPPSAATPSPVQAAYASKPYKGVDYRA